MAMMKQRPGMMVAVVVVVLVVIYLIDAQTEVAVLEDTSVPVGMKKPGRKKTYEEFVGAANMNPNYPIGIPWIDLKDATPYLPKYLKYREYLLTDVVNQDQCTSCWAISVCHMIQDRIAVYTGGKIKRPLSYQELVSCFDVRGDVGCTVGGIPENALRFITENGIATEEDYPYVQGKSTKIVKCDPSKRKGFRTFLQKGSVRSLCIDPDQYEKGSKKWQDTIDQNMKNMQTELYINGPIVCTLQIYQNMYDFDGLSIYSETKGKYIGGHAALIIGMVTADVNGVEPGFDKNYYIIKNSWSSKWPLKSPASRGYVYVEAGKNVAGIESRASRALPVLTDEVRRNMVKSLDESRYISMDSYVQDPERQLFITKATKLRSLLKK
jgi:hypothetical protein